MAPESDHSRNEFLSPGGQVPHSSPVSPPEPLVTRGDYDVGTGIRTVYRDHSHGLGSIDHQHGADRSRGFGESCQVIPLSVGVLDM